MLKRGREVDILLEETERVRRREDLQRKRENVMEEEIEGHRGRRQKKTSTKNNVRERRQGS